MGTLGLSLLVASVVLLALAREQWLPSILGLLRQSPLLRPPERATTKEKTSSQLKVEAGPEVAGFTNGESRDGGSVKHDVQLKGNQTDSSNPPPPLPLPTAPDITTSSSSGETTPKASATTLDEPVPTLTLSGDDKPYAPQAPQLLSSSSSASSASLKPASSSMPPPPPPRLSTLASRPPTLAPLASSRPNPLPPRLTQPRQPGSSTLALPPSHGSVPSKPSRAVVLTPGHSPLDWARLSSSPHVDLRNLPGGPSAPYLRVTPSMLKKMTGRKGKDAWTAMGGKVYNITPYLPFHPGGEAELLRGAGRESTKLFGEVHPWVNYETCWRVV